MLTTLAYGPTPFAKVLNTSSKGAREGSVNEPYMYVVRGPGFTFNITVIHFYLRDSLSWFSS